LRSREKSLSPGVVCGVASPLVIRYVIGFCWWSGIFLRNDRRRCGSSQGVERLLKVEDFPKRHSQIQDAQARNCTTNPARCNHTLQTVETGLTSSVQKEIVVSPIAQAEESLRNPGQQREYNANFHAQDNVKDNAELG